MVPLGAKQEEVVKKLKNENFIRSEKLFTLVLAFLRFPGTIEESAYLLSHRMNTIEVANTLLFHPYQKWIILIPGQRIEEIAEKLEKKFNWDQAKTQDFLSSASEGYLFPDTYLLNVDYTGAEVAQRLIANFHEKFNHQLQKDLLSQNVRNDTTVKIASLIERESGGEEDKALISGIIWNRLNKGMKLEIDATVQYAKGVPGNWWPKVKKGNLKTDSSYNTYLYKGLPPKPIANPSLSSIKAVVYPVETDCFYYLHDQSKEIHCAKTYQEHLENIEKYLR